MLLEELMNASRGWQRNARELAHHPRVSQYFLFQIQMPFKETMSFKPFRSCLFHDVFTVFLFVFRIKAQGCGGSPVSTIYPHNRSFHCSLRSREFFLSYDQCRFNGVGELGPSAQTDIPQKSLPMKRQLNRSRTSMTFGDTGSRDCGDNDTIPRSLPIIGKKSAFQKISASTCRGFGYEPSIFPSPGALKWSHKRNREW